MDIAKKSLEKLKRYSDKKVNKSTIIIYSIVTLLIILILTVTTFFIVAINKIKATNLEKEIEREKEKVQAKYIPDEKNAAYLGLASIIDNQPITLEKILIDTIYIKFYINSSINPKDYDIRLTDDMGNLYAMDNNFIKIDDGKIELRFHYINSGTEGYNLSFKNLATDDFIDFDFNLPKIKKSEDVKYLNNIIRNNTNGIEVNIAGGVFSSAGSSIYYTIETEPTAKYKLKQGLLKNNNDVILYEENTELIPLTKDILLQEVENGIILGRADFEEVDKLNSNLVANFKNLYKSYPINKTVSLDEIDKGLAVFDFDKYKLFVEGMPRFDNLFVLTLHSEDTTIKEGKQENYNRVEVLLDAEVILETPSGAKMTLKPTDAESEYYGTDMLFEIDKKQMEFLLGISPEKIKVKINSVLMEMNDVSIPINLELAMDKMLLEDENMIEEIQNAFISRLEHKYKLSNDIQGISSEVLNDPNLIEEYKPVSDAKGHQFIINLISKKLDNGKLYAIIEEVVKYKQNGEEKIYYKTHSIKATYSDYKWTITSDKIID